MKKLLKYLTDYKKESVLGPLFKLLEALFELFVPLVVAGIIDRGIHAGERSFILTGCLLLFVLALIGLVCSITAQFFAAKAAVGFSTKLRGALFSHIQTLSHPEIDSVGESTLITRMTADINQLQSGVNLFLRLFLRSPFVVFGAMVMAFFVDFKSALVFAVAIPVLAVVVAAIMLVTMPLYKKSQKLLDGILSKTRENITGVRVIRAFSMEEREREDFNARNSEHINLQGFVGRISALMNPLTYALINGAVIVLIYTGALRVDLGILTQGAVVALYNYMSQILVELIKLANMIVTLTKALASANRVSEVFDLEPTIKNATAQSVADTSVAVEFDNASLSYSKESETAVSGVSFKAMQGETIGIIGSTGSGKTSLVNLIPRLYDVTDGSVKVMGKDVREYDLDFLRSLIGIVPQKSVLFKGSIEYNLKWGADGITDTAMENAASAAQAEETVKTKGGYDAEVEAGGSNFSGGQRQRLAIARALAKEPPILILDDSASALDFATDAKLRSAIRSLEFNPTIFVVSQRASSVMSADKIIVLDDGEVKGIGTHDELIKDCDVYSEIYHSQFPEEVSGI